MDALAGTLIGLIGLAVVTAMYFAPTITAGARHHHQIGPIAIINFFAGWTLIGWVVAMAMAASNTRPTPAPAWQHSGPGGWTPQYRTDGQYRTDAGQAPPWPPTPAPPWPSATPHGEPPQERTA